MRFLFALPAVCGMILLSWLTAGCKKKEQPLLPPHYVELAPVNLLVMSGFSLEGDPMGMGVDSALYRYDRKRGAWDRLPFPDTTVVNWLLIRPVCEDADGIVYARKSSYGIYSLKKGGTSWQQLNLPGWDSSQASIAESPVTSPNGSIALIARNGSLTRLYRKMAGQGWTVMREWQTPGFRTPRLIDDAGNVYITSYLSSPDGLVFIPASGGDERQLVDCGGGGNTNLYCNSLYIISQTGEVIYYMGDGVSDEMYRLPAGSSYPATPSLWKKLPTANAIFKQRYQLRDGSTVALGNDCRFCNPQALYLRLGNSDSWYKDTAIPVGYNGQLSANNRDELYCWEFGLSGTASAGKIYKVVLD